MRQIKLALCYLLGARKSEIIEVEVVLNLLIRVLNDNLLTYFVFCIDFRASLLEVQRYLPMRKKFEKYAKQQGSIWR